MAAITGALHTPVLLTEVLEHLRISDDGVYIDCTFGRGGHARAILGRLGQRGRLLGIDRDPEAVAEARSLQEADRRFSIERGSFSMLEHVATRNGVAGKVNGVLFDLGVSSPQLNDPRRGFGFAQDGPLDMRMDPETGIAAAQWLALAKEREIAEVLSRFGEERFARRISRAIVAARSMAPITTTGQLARVIVRANPLWERRTHPATRSFQAVRIFLNQELDEIELALPQAVRILTRGGRLLAISFHSLEDRIVKRFLRKQARGDAYPRGVPAPAAQPGPTLRIIGKAVRATRREIESNPRARSAVLRVAESLV